MLLNAHGHLLFRECHSDTSAAAAHSGGDSDNDDEAKEQDSCEEEAGSNIVLKGKRVQQKVDYIAMNAEMFGDEEDLEGEGSDRDWE